MHLFRRLPRLVTPGLAALVLLAAGSEATAQVTVHLGESTTVQARSVALLLEGALEASGTFDPHDATITFTQTDGSGGIILERALSIALGTPDSFSGTTVHGPVQIKGTLRLVAEPGAHITQGATFTVLTCTSGCAGTFDAVEAPFAVDVHYASDAVTVTVLEAIGTSAEGEAAPGDFVAYPPFPNPFAGATDLRLELEAAADVRVEAFDLLGRRVGVVAAAPFAAGSHRLTWSAEGLGAGTYLLRVRVGRYAPRVWAVTLTR